MHFPYQAHAKLYPVRNRLLPTAIYFTLLIVLLSLVTQTEAATRAITPCTNGSAAGFACNNIDLLAHLPLSAIGGDAANGVLGSDIWGWTSPGGKQYALVGLRNGTSIVDISNPLAPLYLATLPSHQSGLSDYRDIKVYQDHAFIIGDQPYTTHGMQVLDLTQLDAIDRSNAPVILNNSAHYDGIGYAHNMWINEATGYAYLFRGDDCSGATQIVNITNPLTPVNAGCLTINGADSDAECVIYNGPDTDYSGKEICFVGSDSTLGIGDVSDKSSPITIADFTYPNISRAHQGVLTADQRYWLVSDTMDETMGVEGTTNTIIIDISDLDNPTYLRREYYATLASDHNIYLKGTYAYMTNWRAGLRIADISTFSDWDEVAFFDTHPESDSPGAKHGSWSHYEQFVDGTIAVSDVERGLFLLRLDLPPTAIALGSRGIVGQDIQTVVLVAATLTAIACLLLARRNYIH